ncbi:MAG: 4-hydroxy-tetrahydrodipicolinate reductase [bacterium]
MIKVIILGAAGRMGSSIARIASEDSQIRITGLVEKKGHPMIGANLYGCEISNELLDVINKGDCLIDFTSPDSLREHIDIAKENERAMVIGTTGLSKDQMAHMKRASKHIPILYSSNMSFGMNVIFKILPQISKLLSSFDLEIIEAHHKHKLDSPSGTAKRLYEILAESRGYDIERAAVHGRNGKKKKEDNEIGVMSLRVGDVVGDHTIIFGGSGERIELTHRATSRDVFAYGAIRAAKFIVHKEPKLYSILDLL